MANTKQAKKRAAQSERRRSRNRAVVTKVRNIVRGIRKTSETDPKAAEALLPSTVSQLDMAVRKGVLHKKTASRLKSRVTLSTTKATKAKAASAAK
ncbi:MAG: 30S ribosomal protein S20 [Thermoanaerobaculia bacterium]